jgi:hypothetical protein
MSQQGHAALLCRNATYRAVAAHRPGTQVIDLEADVQRGVDAAEGNMFRDAVHLSDYGAAWVSRWMVPASLDLVDQERLAA